ncbi:proline-rich nuclear receptor coactivator 1 [Pristis pectinata]|uniref:proline-rich nuclear receptor coactivator 1 n=1 Tax=Pristis pectinata TaxID=685728 RepID=UPI00223D989D|nr:proline-rich nuclear receptor coactivator 1 [Pristis pectinata]
MVTADVCRPSRPTLGVLARGRKRWRRWEAAMHPLPLPCPPSVPLPVSACSGVKAAAGNRHRPQQHSKTAASRSRKLLSASSTITLLQRHTHQPHLRTQQPGCQSAAGATSTDPRTFSAAASAAASVDERTKEGKAIKSNMERYETISPHTQVMYCVSKTEECFQALNATKKRNKHNLLPKKASVKRNENSHSLNAPSPEGCNVLKKEGGKPVTPGNHYRSLKLQKVGLKSITTLQGDQNYAGPKFSEPPSPSVLPKPPSHWVGVHADYPEDGSKEIMTVHLKTLLKVNA